MRHRTAIACCASLLCLFAGCAGGPTPSTGASEAAATTAPAPPSTSPPVASTGERDSAALGELVTRLADAYVAAYFRHFPDWATVEGRADADHSRLPDNSLAGLAAWRDQEDALLAELSFVDPAQLQAGPRLTYQFLREVLEGAVDRRACETELWEVSPTWTGWQSEYAFLASVQPVGTPELRGAALARFGGLPRYLDQEILRLREGLRRGFSAPKGNVESVIEQMDGLLAGPAAESPFHEP